MKHKFPKVKVVHFCTTVRGPFCLFLYPFTISRPCLTQRVSPITAFPPFSGSHLPRLPPPPPPHPASVEEKGPWRRRCGFFRPSRVSCVSLMASGDGGGERRKGGLLWMRTVLRRISREIRLKSIERDCVRNWIGGHFGGEFGHFLFFSPFHHVFLFSSVAFIEELAGEIGREGGDGKAICLRVCFSEADV